MEYFVGKWGVPIAPVSSSAGFSGEKITLPLEPINVPIKQEPSSDQKPAKILSKEPFFDWFILGFVFCLALVILFLFAGVMDVNLAYSLKYFFIYVVLALTVAMLIAGLIEWAVYKIRKLGFFSVGMSVCLALIIVLVLVSQFVPALLPISNAVLANDGPISADSAANEFNGMKNYYENRSLEGVSGSALRGVYSESAIIGSMDVAFFSSRLGFASNGPSSGKQLFALVTIFRAANDSLSTAVPKFGGILPEMTPIELQNSLSSDVVSMAFMRDLASKSIVVDESKLGDSRAELEGKYPTGFWLDARGSAITYLAEFLSFKRTSLSASLDANNFIAAFIEANQLDYLQKAYGKVNGQ